MILRILFFCCSLLLAFNAEAFVKLKASKALSFKNVANDNRASTNPNAIAATRSAGSSERALEQHTMKPETVTADLTGSTQATVYLKYRDRVVVSIEEEEDGYIWETKVSSSALAHNSEETTDGVKKITYELTKRVTSFVYFDYKNTATNEIEKSRMLVVKLK